MAFRLVYSLQLAAGITDLRAQLLNADGSNNGGAISTGFTSDLGSGQYLWDYSSFPDGFYGAVAFYRASTPSIRWIHAINPQEGENLDGKVTSRMATFSYTAPDNAGIASIVAGVSALIATIGAAGAGLTALPGMVWSNSARTLTGFGTLVADNWSYVTRTLTGGGGGATAAEIWSYATRALTSLGMAGGIEYTYTLTSSGGGTIADALLWFATDAAISNTVWFGTTDAFGVARDANGNKPRLAPGTYYIRAQKSGYTFDIDTETVS